MAQSWDAFKDACVLRLVDFDDDRIARLGEGLGVPGLLSALGGLGSQSSAQPGLRRPQDLVWRAEALRRGEAPTDSELLTRFVRRSLADPDPAHGRRLVHLSVELRERLIGRAVGSALLQGQDALTLDVEAAGAVALADALLGETTDFEALLGLPLLRVEADRGRRSRWRTPHRRIDEHLTAVALQAAVQRIPIDAVASALGPRNGCPPSLFGVFHRWLELSEPADQLALVRWDPVAALAWLEFSSLPIAARARCFKELVELLERPDGTPWFLAQIGWEVAERWLARDLASEIEETLCEVLDKLATPASPGTGREPWTGPNHLHALVLGGIAQLSEPSKPLADAAARVFRSGQVPTWLRRRARDAWGQHPEAAHAATVSAELQELLQDIRERPLESSIRSMDEPDRPEDGRDSLIVAHIAAVVPSRFGFETVQARRWIGRLLAEPALRGSISFDHWRLGWTLAPEDAVALLADLPKGASAALPSWAVGLSRPDPLEAALVGQVSAGARPEPLAAWVVQLDVFAEPDTSPLAQAVRAWAEAAPLDDWLAFHRGCYLKAVERTPRSTHELDDWLHTLRRLNDTEYLKQVAQLPLEPGRRALRQLWYGDQEGDLSHESLSAFARENKHLQPALEGLPDREALRAQRAAFAAERAERSARRAARPDPAAERRARVDAWLQERTEWVPAAAAGDEPALLYLIDARLIAQCEQRPSPPDYGEAIQRGAVIWAQGTSAPEPSIVLSAGQKWLYRELLSAGLNQNPPLAPDRATSLLALLLRLDGTEAHANLLLDRGADAEAAVRGLWALASDAGSVEFAKTSAGAVFRRLDDRTAAKLAWEWLRKASLAPKAEGHLAQQVKRCLAVVEPSPITGALSGAVFGLRLLRQAEEGADLEPLWRQRPMAQLREVRTVIGDPFEAPPCQALDRLRLSLAVVELDRAVASDRETALRRLGRAGDRAHWPPYAREFLLEQARVEHAAAQQPDPGEPLEVSDLDPAPPPPPIEHRRWHHQQAREELRHLAAGLHRARRLGPDPRIAALLAGERPPGVRGVFLCYNRKHDSADVQALYAALKGRLGEGLVFKDTESVQPGEDWYQRLREGLGRASLLVVWGTQAWLDAPYPRWELGYAQGLGARVFTVVVDAGAKEDLQRLRGIADFQWLEPPSRPPHPPGDDASTAGAAEPAALREWRADIARRVEQAFNLR